MIKDLLLYFALLLWFVVPSKAQPTIFVEDGTAKQGELITVPVKVKNFELIEAMQFSFSWDADILAFESFGEFVLPNMVEQNFGPAKIDSFINLVWLAPAATPQYTLSDGSTAFNIIFKVVGEPKQKSDLSFPGEPVTNLVIQEYQEITLNNESAMFTVEDPVSNRNIFQVKSISSSPNPFKDFTKIQFELKEKVADLQFVIYDATGKEVLNRTQDFTTGLNEILISKEMLKGEGLYFYRIFSANFDFTDTIILN